MRSRFVELPTGLRQHLFEWGGDDARLDHTVVLLHGFLDLAWGWRRTVEAGLAERCHVVAPDLRGHGDSDRVGAGGYYHFLDYLADLDGLIAQVGRARVSLVGHSMGGSIASYFAGSFPGRVHRLALLEGTGPPESSNEEPERVGPWIAAWSAARRRQTRNYATLDEAAARLQKGDPLLDAAQARELAEKGCRQNGDGTYAFKHDPLHLTAGPLGFRVAFAERFWRRVACPVLLVEGSASLFRHAGEERARRHAAFADRSEALLEGAGHMMQRHRPAELAALLAAFLF
jgi:pimeloyl-ACP methyl ester carboxylesterase